MDPCGYSVVSVGAGPTPLAQGAMWATLEEQRQTVPRAELAAVILLLTHVRGPILVHVDRRSIHSNWTCRSLKATAIADLRFDFWCLMDQRVEPFEMQWMPSHRYGHDVVQVVCSPTLRTRLLIILLPKLPSHSKFQHIQLLMCLRSTPWCWRCKNAWW